METTSFFSLETFEGLATLVASEPKIAIARVVLILLGFLFIYLGRKGVLEALIMVPMGLGMAVVNAGVLFWNEETNVQGTLNLNALAGAEGQSLEQAADVVYWLQIDWLQPIYSLMFSNGLVACMVFMGIGVLLDVGFVMARPFQSMFLALCAFRQLFEGPVLYSATFLLGLVLGVLCEANTLLDPSVFKLLVLGIAALFFSGVGGLLGGYVLYFATGKKYNPVIGIAGVSCVPTTAKVAQKEVSYANPSAIVLPHALGANVSGVITTAILASIYISHLR